MNKLLFFIAICAVIFAPAALSQPFSVDTNTVALWHFDEGTGNTVFDASPYHHDGQIFHAAWIAGEFGSALHFNGITSYVSLPATPALKPEKEFTIEASFMLDTLYFGDPNMMYGAEPVLLGCLGAYPSGGGYQVSFSNEGIVFDYRVGNPISEFTHVIPIPAAHVFYNLKATYQHVDNFKKPFTVLKMYLDDALVDSVAYHDEIQYYDTPMFYIGSNGDGRAVTSYYDALREFPGTIDEIRISNIARTVPVYVPPPPPPDPMVDSNTVALWHFDEGTGDILHDATPYQNDGEIHNATWVTGEFGGGLHFDGLTSYVSLPASPELKPEKEFTLEAWFNLDTLYFCDENIPGGPGPVLMGCLGPYPYGGGYQISFTNRGLLFDYRVGYPISEFSDTIPIPSAHVFYHVKTTYQHAENFTRPLTVIKVYLDDILVDSVAYHDQINYCNASMFYIGSNLDGRATGPGNYGVREFPGTIDEVRISNIARTVPVAQPQSDFIMDIALTVTDSASNQATLHFGTSPGATDGIDPMLGEEELPPLPPYGTFDVRWVINGANGSWVNYEDTLSAERTSNTYTGIIRPGQAGYPIQLQWDASEVSRGSFFLQDAGTHGTIFRVDLSAQNSLLITGSTPTTFEIVYSAKTTMTSSINDEWSMVSVPMTVDNPDYHAVFPDAKSTPFTFAHGYHAVESVETGVGYWVKFGNKNIAAVHGTPVLTTTIPVKAGWNMIGSVALSVDILNVQKYPETMTLSKYYSYQGGYHGAGAIDPMRAYWVRAGCDGQLVISGTSGKSNPASRLEEPSSNRLNSITISEGAHHSQQLYFTIDRDGAMATLDEEYAAPPKPPAGIFDARFAGEQYLARLGGHNQQSVIELDGKHFPLNVAWQMNDGAQGQYALINLASGKEIARLAGSHGTVRITEQQARGSIALQTMAEGSSGAANASSYRLEQNYPNPFNPSTSIAFTLKHDVHVQVKIYNIMGQEVADLMNGDMKSGSHEIRWDASAFPTGAYWYRIVTPEFSAARTMLYVR